MYVRGYLQGSENGRVVTIDFWLCLFLRNSQRKSGVGKMNGSVITNRLQNSFKIKDNNVYGSSYYWNFRTSSFKQVARLILEHVVNVKTLNGSEHDDLLNDDMDFMLSQVAENISFFFLLKLKILEAKVHMTQLFLKKFLIFTKF